MCMYNGSAQTMIALVASFLLINPVSSWTPDTSPCFMGQQKIRGFISVCIRPKAVIGVIKVAEIGRVNS